MSYFTIDQATFHEQIRFSLPGFKTCLQRTLCSDSRKQLLLSDENKHVSKKLASYLTPGQATMTKMTANGFSSFRQTRHFLIHFATKSVFFAKEKKTLFNLQPKNMFIKDFVF